MKSSKLYVVLRPLITLVIKGLFRPQIIGKEKIPEKGRIVLAGNHKSMFDCVLLLATTKRTIHFLAKKELFVGPKKIIFSHLGAIPVDRQRKSHESLELAMKCLNEDKVIGIFPEGTFNRTDEVVMPFKIGAVKMAYETNSSIIPFVIKGDYKLFSKNLVITFLDPIKVEKNLDKANEKLRNKIKKKLEG